MDTPNILFVSTDRIRGDFFMEKKAMAVRGSPGQKPRQNANPQMRAVAIGCLLATALGVVLIGGLSLAMSAGRVPIWAVNGIGLVLGCILAAAAAFFCARSSGQNGFFLGMLCAAILFVVCFLISLSLGESPSLRALIKLFSMLICGCVFGSIGVNIRSRKRV